MKKLLITLLFLLNSYLFTQTLDPYNFFPSSVGNVWEYNSNYGVFQRIIVKDTLLEDGCKLFYYNTLEDPVFKIDTSYQMFKYPFDLNLLHYKLDADSGDTWIVEKEVVNDTMTLYKLAQITSIYNGYFYNKNTTFKEITYYIYQYDTIINEFSWAERKETLAYGIGLVSVFNEEGGPEEILLGCIIDGDTIGIITSVEDEQKIPNSFELYQNYPNPFNPKTTIKFSITEPTKIKLIVYSLLGEEIKVLIDEYKNSGTHSIIFDATGLPSGVYIYSLLTGNKTLSKKLILLK